MKEGGKRGPSRPNLYDRPIFPHQKPMKTRVGSGIDATDRAAMGPSPLPFPKSHTSFHTKMAFFVLIMVVALGALGIVVFWPRESGYVLDTFQYATVETGDFRLVIEAPGRIVPSVVDEIRAAVDGQVEAVYYKAGESVPAGALLASLTSPSLLADMEDVRRQWTAASLEADEVRQFYDREVTQARRDLALAEERLAEREGQIPILERLYALGGVAKKELDEAKEEVRHAAEAVASAAEGLALVEERAQVAVERAKQQRAAVEARLQVLEKRLDHLRVVAPSDGYVFEAVAAAGEEVRQGDVLFRLADGKHVEMTVSQEQAALIDVGGAAVVFMEDGGEAGSLSGGVSAAVSQIVPASEQSARVLLTLSPHADVVFLPGERVLVAIEWDELKDRPFLPRGPFFSSGDARFVYVLNSDHSRAERRDVRYGVTDGDRLEIVSGLHAGEQIVFNAYTAFRSFPTIQLNPEGGQAVGSGR